MKLSIVTTMYHSAPYLREFYERITKAANKITNDYEIIFVDDGSPDNSLDIVLELHKQDSRIKVIELSRNFGHHKAIMTGLEQACGDYTFLIDCDLEEAPELLNEFWEILLLNDQDVIYGTQSKRRDGLISRLLATMYYGCVNYLSSVQIARNFCTVRLFSRRYCLSLLKYGEKELNFSLILSDCGFNQKEIKIDKKCKGQTTYTLAGKMRILLDAITSFSSKPLYYIFILGFFISLVSFVIVLYVIFRHIFFAEALVGWTSLIASIWLLGGLILLSIGVIGIYLSKIFLEVKQRPRSIIKEVYCEK